MRTSLNIADQFLVEAAKKNKDLTPMQLLKLVYIAHGFSLGAYDRELISDHVEAWKYGPVIPRLYAEVKKFGKNRVSNNVSQSTLSPLEEWHINLIEWVYDRYKSMDGIQLSELTHRKGSPWDTVYNSPLFVGSNVIDNDLIAHHYKQFIK